MSYEVIGACRDVDGQLVKVGRNGNVVMLDVGDKSGEFRADFGPDERDAFIKLWAEAGRRAEHGVSRG